MSSRKRGRSVLEQRLGRLAKGLEVVSTRTSQMAEEQARLLQTVTDVVRTFKSLQEDIRGSASSGNLLQSGRKRRKTSVDEEKLVARERKLELHESESKARERQAEETLQEAFRVRGENNRFRESVILARDCGEPMPPPLPTNANEETQ